MHKGKLRLKIWKAKCMVHSTSAVLSLCKILLKISQIILWLENEYSSDYQRPQCISKDCASYKDKLESTSDQILLLGGLEHGDVEVRLQEALKTKNSWSLKFGGCFWRRTGFISDISQFKSVMSCKPQTRTTKHNFPESETEEKETRCVKDKPKTFHKIHTGH